MLQCKTASENAFGFTTAPVGWICTILDVVEYTKCQNVKLGDLLLLTKEISLS